MVRFTVDNRNRLIFYGNPVGYVKADKVTVSFAQEANPTLSALVRNTLLDAYIRKNGLCSEEQPA